MEISLVLLVVQAACVVLSVSAAWLAYRMRGIHRRTLASLRDAQALVSLATVLPPEAFPSLQEHCRAYLEAHHIRVEATLTPVALVPSSETRH